LLRHVALVIVLVSLAACSGGGGGGSSSAPGTPVVTPTSGSQSNFVRPKITFKEPVKSRHGVKGAKGGKYLSAGAKGITVTLISSAAGLSGLSATSDLTAPGTCSNGTCTIYGPAIPPGMDTLGVTEYAEVPTGSPLAEPNGAHAVATSSSTASPSQSNPSFTIVAGQDNQISVTLYGVPAVLTIPNNQINFRADVYIDQEALSVGVEDYLDNSISGEYSEPITVTDSDTVYYGTQLFLQGSNQGVSTVTLNSSTDRGKLAAYYYGQAEAPPTVTATASGGITSGPATPFVISFNPIVITPVSGYSAETQTKDEIDLFAESGTGSTAAVTLSELGWTDYPFDQKFSYTSGTCSVGTPGATYGLTTADNLTFTDTAPASAAPGICPVTFTDFTGGNSVTETLTYTETTIGVNKKNHLLHPTRTH